MKIILDRTYFDKNNKEIQFGDILQIDFYPYYREEENNYNYYGIVAWDENDEDVVVVTAVGDNERISGISDGNCEFLKDFDEDEDKNLKKVAIIGNVKNNEDVNKYLRDKDWTYADCTRFKNTDIIQ